MRETTLLGGGQWQRAASHRETPDNLSSREASVVQQAWRSRAATQAHAWAAGERMRGCEDARMRGCEDAHMGSACVLGAAVCEADAPGVDGSIVQVEDHRRRVDNRLVMGAP